MVDCKLIINKLIIYKLIINKLIIQKLIINKLIINTACFVIIFYMLAIVCCLSCMLCMSHIFCRLL